MVVPLTGSAQMGAPERWREEKQEMIKLGLI